MKKAILVLVVYAIMVVVPYQLAQSSITVGGTTLGSGVTVWDEVLDLGASSNICNDFATAVRSWMETGWTANHSVLVTGTGTVAAADFFDAGDFRRCWALGTTTSFDDAGDDADHPLFDKAGTDGGVLNIRFESAFVAYNMGTSQAEPSIFFMVGNGYETGFSTTTSSDPAMNKGVGPQVTISGSLTLRNANTSAEESGWTSGEYPPHAPFDESSTTTFIGMLTTNAGTDMSNFHLNMRGYEVTGTTYDDDDIGFVSMYSNAPRYGTIDIEGYGVGALIYSSFNGDFWRGHIGPNQYGLVFGDTTEGGDSVVTENCRLGGDYCDGGVATDQSRAATVSDFHWPAGLIIEGNTAADVVVIDASDANFDGHNIEMTSTTAQNAVILGAGVDDDGSLTPCCLDTDTGVGACDPVPGVGRTTDVTGFVWGAGKSLNGKTHASRSFLCLGPGFQDDGGSGWKRYADFTEASWFYHVNTAIWTAHGDADGTMILNSLGWRFNDTQTLPAYTNVSFEDAVSFTAGINDTAPDVTGAECLPMNDPNTAGSVCSTANVGAQVHGWTFREDVYVHRCIVDVLSAPDGTGWDAGDDIVLDMEPVNSSGAAIGTKIGNSFTIQYNDSCSGINCVDQSDGVGSYVWFVNGRSNLADGYLQIEIDDTSTDTNADLVLDLLVNCDQVSVPIMEWSG